MKIGFFITARLKSTRLKQKILLNLNGKSILERIIERCKALPGLDGVVLCTSTNPEDSILYDYAQNHKIKYFAGSEEDVLNRLQSAALYYGFDAFLSITADNPLFSIYISQIILNFYKQKKLDFIFSKGLPIGCCPALVTTQSLQIVNFIKKDNDTEIWGPFVNHSDIFNIGEIIVTNSPFKEEKRLTCDYPQDYLLLSKIYKYFPNDYLPDIHEILEIMKQNPAFWEINSMHQQRYLSDEEVKRINLIFNNKKNDALEYATLIGKNLKSGYYKFEVEI